MARPVKRFSVPCLNRPSSKNPLEAVRDRIAKAIGKVTIPRNVRTWHPAIEHLLSEDERRRERQESSPYSYLSDAPIFDTPFERRRLRILNSLLLATAKMSGRPSVGDPEAREICITFHHQHVAIALDRPKGPRKRKSGSRADKARRDNTLYLSIRSSTHSESDRMRWQDEEGNPLEHKLTEIVTEIVLTAERKLREGAVRHYEWWLKRRAELDEEERQRQLAAKRAARERQAKLEQARIDRLLNDAAALRQAADIRVYVESVRSEVEQGEANFAAEDLERWIAWAHAQANRIDPLHNRAFLDSMRDQDPDD